MKANQIFRKTTKGRSEIETRTGALSVRERSVLILANGENTVATLKQLSLCENIAEVLDFLLDQGFIERDSVASSDSATSDGTASATDISARELMCNTLLTFANRVRVGKLIEEIYAVEDIDSLKNLVKSWYHAISETPGGMYQADDLRQEVLLLINDEEFGGIRQEINRV